MALIPRGRDGLDATRREITGLGRKTLAIAADVADHDQVEQAAAFIEREWGGIDVCRRPQSRRNGAQVSAGDGTISR